MVDIASTLKPSKRGELEITDVNLPYLRKRSALGRTDGPGLCLARYRHAERLLDASNFIRSIEVRQGVKIGCLEEIALHNGWITSADVERIIAASKSSSYARYLKLILDEAKDQR